MKWRSTEDPIDVPSNGAGTFGRMSSWLRGDDKMGPACEEETQGLLGMAQGGLQNMAEKAGDTLGFGTAMQVAVISKQQWFNFGVLLLLGCLLMSFSLASFPLLFLAPQKFATMFTLGSLLILSSFGALKGWSNFVSHLTSKERMPFSAAYFGSMLATCWASLWYRSSILTIVFSVVQVTQLLWFFVSYIPGGSSVLSVVCDTLKKACCGLCFKSSGSIPL